MSGKDRGDPLLSGSNSASTGFPASLFRSFNRMKRFPTFLLGVLVGFAAAIYGVPAHQRQSNTDIWAFDTSSSRSPSSLPALDCPVCPVCNDGDGNSVDYSTRGVEALAIDAAAKFELSPDFLARGPRSQITATYYKPNVDVLTKYGPPEPSCFDGITEAPVTPRRFDTVLILAQGRSGSTSLLRLLNTFPCYNVRGENPNVFTHVVGRGPRPFKKQTGDTYMMARNMIAEKNKDWSIQWSDTDMKLKPSWFNRLSVERTDGVLRLLVAETLEHVPGRVTSGFKSITLFSPRGQNYNISRWFVDDWIRLFPKTAIIFITRKDVANSGWWRVTGKAPEMMAEQEQWFKRFHAEIPIRYPKASNFPNRHVKSAFVDYDDLIKCRHDDGTLSEMYEMLGETWKPERCKAVMKTNIEDWGVAMSEFEFYGNQGEKFWTYGWRELPLVPGQTGEELQFGEYQLLEDHENSTFTGELEWKARPYPHSPPLTLGRALHMPTVGRDKSKADGEWKIAAPCRKWAPYSDMKSDIEIRVPALLPVCNATHDGFTAVLLISDKPVKSATYKLGSQGGIFKRPSQLTKDDRVELCIVPTFSEAKDGENHRVCAPLLASVVMLRGGTG